MLDDEKRSEMADLLLGKDAEIEELLNRVTELESELAHLKEQSSEGFLNLATSKFRGFFGKTRQPNFEKEAALLKSSVHFDSDWYLARYSDIATDEKWSEQPELHYLQYGWKQKRNPSASFDTAWYLSCYDDIRAAKVNPLVHFILHGEAEGRLPVKPEAGSVSHISVGRADYLNKKLWSGFSGIALPGLERVVELGSRRAQARALWYLARWEFAHGGLEEAARKLEAIVEIKESLDRRTIVALNKVYTLLGEYDAATDLLQQPAAVKAASKALPFIEANSALALPVAKQTEVRLRAINSLFWNHGLVGIHLVEPLEHEKTSGLDIHSIVSTNVPSAHSMLGIAKDEIPLVSIIIPVYNAADTIHIALESLLAQSWQNLEVIVVDDFSDDDTAAVVESFQERDSRVRLLRHDINRGAYPARNYGVGEARGDFITVHDSDDWSHPQKIEKQARVLLHDETKVASVSNWVRVKQDLRFVGSWYLDENFIEKNHSSALFRRRVIETIGGWDNVNVGGDTEYLWRVELAFDETAVVSVLPDVPLSFALELGTSLTRTSATHVKTIHYGLRRLYREAARWWLNQCEDAGKLPTAIGHDPEFPSPLGNKRGAPRQFETMLVADFSTENNHLLELLTLLTEMLENKNKELVLFHWPDFNQWTGATLAPEVLALCQKYKIQFSHYGLELSAKKLVFFNAGLWENRLDEVPKVNGLELVEVVKVSDAPVSEALMNGIKTYFRSGGLVV